MEEKKNRNRWLNIRLTAAEHRVILTSFSRTTEQKLSGYARKILLGKPMIAGVRDQNMQDILSELIKIRSDLNGAANNLNQVVRKLHSLPSNLALSLWLSEYERESQALTLSLSDIKNFIAKMEAKWLLG